jgi:predicted nucleic acid-binding protein
MDGGGALIVADTNLIVALSLQTDNSALADSVRKKDGHWIAPQIWQSKFRNAALGMMRAGKIGMNTANAAFQFAMDNVDTFDISTGAVLRLAEIHGLSAYDAEFAVLAEWLECKAVAFDDDLLKPGLAIHPREFSK